MTNARFEVGGKSTNKDEFVICRGVPIDEVDMGMMQSRVTPGLYFAGELLGVDGVTGGYDFQNAWTTGRLASQAIADDLVQLSLACGSILPPSEYRYSVRRQIYVLNPHYFWSAVARKNQRLTLISHDSPAGGSQIAQYSPRGLLDDIHIASAARGFILGDLFCPGAGLVRNAG